MTSVIKVQNLYKTYHTEGVDTPVLFDIDLDIKKGEFVAIMGPSGSGKSTLLHILGLLDSFDKGKYFLDDVSVSTFGPEEVARLRNEKLGFVFQAFNLLARTSVLENVKLPLLYSNVPEGEWDVLARDALEAVGLSHRLEFEPSQLSGGEKQRVAIARALVLKPPVIFADEPTGNLDSKSGKAVMEAIQNLNEKKGHTVVLITHERTTAEHAHRILHIVDGRIDKDEKVGRRRKASDEFLK
jgi:ABC-type lipoprotein export system ATPase subunit